MISYSINDLEKITGIKAHTIRIWEKRYNVVCPKRTPTNIRYYQDCDIKKLLNIGTLNRHGFKISQIARMSSDEINEKILEITGKSNDFDSQINSLLVAMMELDEDAFELVLSRATLKLGFERTVTQILFPFMERIGVLWQIGTINPAQEHFVSNLIRQKLIVAADGQQQLPRADAPTFVLFLPEGELHELGLLYYNYLLKKNAVRVIYLGQTVPFDDLVQIAKTKKVDVLITYFVSAMIPDEIPDYVRKLSATFHDKEIFISGLQLQQISQTWPENVIEFKDSKHFKEHIRAVLQE